MVSHQPVPDSSAEAASSYRNTSKLLFLAESKTWKSKEGS